jgi:hypothetical protein
VDFFSNIGLTVMPQYNPADFICKYNNSFFKVIKLRIILNAMTAEPLSGLVFLFTEHQLVHK